MNLGEWSAHTKRSIFADLEAGLEPQTGDFDQGILKDARSKSTPQMGTTVYMPEVVRFEFLYNDPNSSTIIFSVTVRPPERVVYLPVPSWVVESIWQGEVDGSYHFESDARRLLDEFALSLEPANNKALFGKKQPIHRE